MSYIIDAIKEPSKINPEYVDGRDTMVFETEEEAINKAQEIVRFGGRQGGRGLGVYKLTKKILPPETITENIE